MAGRYGGIIRKPENGRKGTTEVSSYRKKKSFQTLETELRIYEFFFCGVVDALRFVYGVNNATKRNFNEMIIR